MIVNPPVHVAYAYDMLSILAIKTLKIEDKSFEQNIKNYNELSDYLAKKLGSEFHSKLVRSEEYINLYNANMAVFKRIDEIKIRGEQLGDATYIDQNNYARYVAKKLFQEKFFPDLKFTEQKIGYNEVKT